MIPQTTANDNLDTSAVLRSVCRELTDELTSATRKHHPRVRYWLSSYATLRNTGDYRDRICDIVELTTEIASANRCPRCKGHGRYIRYDVAGCDAYEYPVAAEIVRCEECCNHV